MRFLKRPHRKLLKRPLLNRDKLSIHIRKPYVLIILMICGSCATRQADLESQLLRSPTSTLLQSVSIVDENTVWISGHDASFVRSQDAGESWELFQYPLIDTLQFRDIHAFDPQQAILMSAGPGPMSRIFTFEAPDRWEENFVMEDSLGFLDCIDFWDRENGIAYGDAIDRYPYILLTTDGGRSWHRADTTNMPLAGEGEGGFAASGTCVTTGENGKAWVATGAGGNARFLMTADYGLTWRSIDSPIIKGEAAGHTAVSFLGQMGFAAGGDLAKPDEYTENCAFSEDGGLSWTLAKRPQIKGAFYGGALTKVHDHYYAFACGPKGLDYSADFGTTWTSLDTLNYWAISFYDDIGYASGTNGKILKISLR